MSTASEIRVGTFDSHVPSVDYGAVSGDSSVDIRAILTSHQDPVGVSGVEGPSSESSPVGSVMIAAEGYEMSAPAAQNAMDRVLTPLIPHHTLQDNYITLFGDHYANRHAIQNFSYSPGHNTIELSIERTHPEGAPFGISHMVTVRFGDCFYHGTVSNIAMTAGLRTFTYSPTIVNVRREWAREDRPEPANPTNTPSQFTGHYLEFDGVNGRIPVRTLSYVPGGGHLNDRVAVVEGGEFLRSLVNIRGRIIELRGSGNNFTVLDVSAVQINPDLFSITFRLDEMSPTASDSIVRGHTHQFDATTPEGEQRGELIAREAAERHRAMREIGHRLGNRLGEEVAAERARIIQNAQDQSREALRRALEGNSYGSPPQFVRDTAAQIQEYNRLQNAAASAQAAAATTLSAGSSGNVGVLSSGTFGVSGISGSVGVTGTVGITGPATLSSVGSGNYSIISTDNTLMQGIGPALMGGNFDTYGLTQGQATPFRNQFNVRTPQDIKPFLYLPEDAESVHILLRAHDGMLLLKVDYKNGATEYRHVLESHDKRYWKMGDVYDPTPKPKFIAKAMLAPADTRERTICIDNVPADA